MKTTMIATALTIALGASAQAATVDFSTNFGVALGEGAVVTGFDFGAGLTGSISGVSGGNATGDVVVFDTTPGTVSVGNDPDLRSPFTNVNDPLDARGFGNALILQENPGTQGPDDAARGGAITFSFDGPVTLSSLTILDGADNSPTGASLLIDGVLLAGFTGLGGGDREFETVLPNVIVNDSFTVHFAGSGAIGEFQAAAVPVPAALPLALSAFIGLGLLGRRRRA